MNLAGAHERISGHSRLITAPAPSPEELYLEATWKLLKGNLREGFRDYEIRWQTAHQKPYAKNYTEPQWTGQPLDGKTIFVWNEQGFGDTIMMHRYVRLLEEMAAKVVISPQPALAELFRANTKAKIAADGEEIECDYQVPTLSLPFACETTLTSIPAPTKIVPGKPIFWEPGAGFNVGLCWAGNINHPDDTNRSVAFDTFKRILRVRDVKFWGLQRNLRKHELDSVTESGITLLHFDGFDAFAAIVDKMDLIITVDSALAHLAGAMGKPCWVLIQENPDWRWMLNRSDSPWYPSLRLFRQRRLGEWKPVLDHMIELLRRKSKHVCQSN
jgi:hypothetical protein